MNRNQFIKASFSGAISLHPSVKFLSHVLGVRPEDLDALITRDFQFTRPDDLLSLYFYFINIDPKRNDVLRRLNPGKDAYMLVRLPQMHVAEHLLTDCQYYSKGKQDLTDNSFFDHGETVKSFSSSYSFFAFKLNFQGGDINFSQAELLNWNKHTLLTEADLNIKGISYPITVKHTTAASAYPIAGPGQSPFLTADGIPVSVLEFPYKFYITPAGGQDNNSRYYFYLSNDLHPLTIYGGKNNPGTRVVNQLFNNEMLRSSKSGSGSPSFRIVGYAEDYGGIDSPDLNESEGEKRATGAPANTCGDAAKNIRTAGLLPYGSYAQDGIPRPGVGNGLHHRKELAFLSNIKNAGDRDLHSTLFLFTAWGGYSFFQYFNPITKDPATNTEYNIRSFKERIVLGRDEFIEVVTEGYDQFCIKCYYILIGKVSFVNGNRYLRNYAIIKYPDNSGIIYQDAKGREIARGGVLQPASTVITRLVPYKSIQPVTLQTPELDPARDITSITCAMAPGIVGCDPSTPLGGLLINYNKQPFVVEYKATDWNGNTLKIVKPLIYIDKAAWSDPKTLSTLNTVLNSAGSAAIAPFRIAQAFKQKIAYVSMTDAELKLAYPDAVSANHKVNEVQTDWIEFYSNLAVTADDEGKLPCMPMLNEASVFLPQLQGLVSSDINIGINYAQSYLTSRFDDAGNRAMVFANLTERSIEAIRTQLSDPQNLKALGALVTPDIPIESLSVRAQSITLHENAVIDKALNLDPKEILRGSFPALFRGIDLLSILNEFIPLDDTPIFNVVQQFNQDLDDVDQKYQDVVETIQNVRTTVQQKLQTAKDQLNNATANMQAIAGKNPACQRFIALKTEVQYNTRILKVRNAADNFVKDELAKAGYQAQNTLATIAGAIEKLPDQVLLACTGINDVNVAKAQAKNAYTQYAAAIEKQVQASFDNFQAALTAIVTDAKLTDPVSHAMLDYQSIKAALIKETITVSSLVDSYVSDVSGAGKFAALFPTSQRDALLTGHINNLVNLHFTKALSTINDPKNKSEDITAAYTVLTGFLSQIETEANLKAKINAADPGVVNLLAFNKEWQNRKKLFVDFYTEKSTELVNEIKTVQAGILDNKIVAAAIAAAETASQVRFPCGGFAAAATDAASYFPLLNQQIAQAENLKKSFNDTINKELEILNNTIDSAQQQLDQYQDELNNGIAGALQEATDELNDAIQQVMTATGTARQEIQDKIALMQRVIQYIQQGTQISRSYTWNTTGFRDADLDILQFKVHTDPPTELDIDCTAQIKLDYSQIPPSIKSYTFSNTSTLKNFSIVFLGILDVNFRYVQFTDSTSAGSHLDVKIDKVGFTGALAFLQTLQSLFSQIGDLKQDIQPLFLQLSYSLKLPDLPSSPASFGFANLLFDFGVKLPFDGNPLQCSFSLAQPNNKFRVTAGIFTGWGYFGVVAQPKNGIESLAIALEMGVYAGFSIGGVLNGYVQFGVGIYYGRTGSTVKITGYISCEGHADLFGFGVTVSLYMGFTSVGNTCTGECTVKFSISLGFFSLDFEEGYQKTIYGSGAGGNNASARLPESSLAFSPIAHGQGYAGGPFVSGAATNERSQQAIDEEQFEQYWNAFF